jgi:hypothetical protein
MHCTVQPAATAVACGAGGAGRTSRLSAAVPTTVVLATVLLPPDHQILLVSSARQLDRVLGIRCICVRRGRRSPNPPPPAVPPTHPGCAAAYDILFTDFDFSGALEHDVGTGTGGQYGV